MAQKWNLLNNKMSKKMNNLKFTSNKASVCNIGPNFLYEIIISSKDNIVLSPTVCGQGVTELPGAPIDDQF